WLLWVRRTLIVAMIVGAYWFYRSIGGQDTLSSLGMAACVAALQFMPGVLAVLYWPRANRIGFLGGLLAGFLVWFIVLMLPLISDFNPSTLLGVLLGIPPPAELRSGATIVSLGLNTPIFAVLSLLAPPAPQASAAPEARPPD